MVVMELLLALSIRDVLQDVRGRMCSKWLRTTVTIFSKMQRVQQIYSPSALFSSLCVFREVKKC